MPYSDPDKQKKFQREHCSRKRLAHITRFGGKCKNCESTYRLEFDHIDRSKKVSHRIWSWSEERISEELSKCQLICKKCHQEKTATEMGYKLGPTHGTTSGYDHHKCRCRPCTSAKTERMRRYRMSKIYGTQENAKCAVLSAM